MTLPILYNRDGTIGNDGWMHIVPRGELPNAEAGVVQVLDDAALDSILANLKADTQKAGLYFGEEHFIYDPTKSSQAFAWAKEFEKRDDGIWAKPELTDLGTAAITNKRFKFTSFVADPGNEGSIEQLDGDRVRIRKIDTVGFTNFANGKHLLKPLSNRDGTDPSHKTKPKGTVRMKNLLKELGLSDDASEESAIAEVTKIRNRCKSLETGNEDLRTTNRQLLEAQVDADLEKYADRIENKDAVKALLLSNRADAIKFLEAMKKPEAKKATPPAPLHNRATARTPTDSPTKVIKNRQAQQREKVEAYRIANRCTFEQAWNGARALNPELFAEETQTAEAA
jgi:phage I-like protein